jgi:hypothetical protein
MDPRRLCAMKLTSFVDVNRNHLTTMECSECIIIMINIFKLWFGTSNKIVIHMPSSLIGTVELHLLVHGKIWEFFFFLFMEYYRNYSWS